jgi:hypothetical protein
LRGACLLLRRGNPGVLTLEKEGARLEDMKGEKPSKERTPEGGLRCATQ